MASSSRDLGGCYASSRSVLVLVGSIALLALAFLVVLGPLILDTLAAYLSLGGGRRMSL